jgi:ribosome modulation factor
MENFMSDAFSLGAQAYAIGDSMELNPYDERDAQHDEWDDGYAQASFSDSDFDVGN